MRPAELQELQRLRGRGVDLSKLALAVEASLLSEDFVAFVKGAWHVVEPNTPMRWGWALDAICEHLVAVTNGQIKRLLVNVPPGMMKSLLVNVMWPAWEWTRPSLRHLRYLGTAHKQDLAVRDNMKCRRLIQSQWYQKRWPVELTSDQNAKTKFENSVTGFREAMAFTSMTGSRGDRVLLDDPLSVDNANSEADLKAAETTFLEALPTRVNNEDSAIIIIMQRLAEGDTSGIVMSRKLPYDHLMLPMEFEPDRRCKTSIGFVDPRTKDGELLFPERFSAKQVAELKTTLGSYATAGQLQQRPTPRGGGMFKDRHLMLWPLRTKIPDLLFIVQSYDTAFTEKTSNDPTAHTTWGVFRHPTRGVNCVLLLDAWDEHLSYTALRRRVIADWKTQYGGEVQNKKGADPARPPRRADECIVENKGSGISLIQELNAAGIPAFSYNPGKADKVGRAFMVQPLYESNLVYVLESAKEPGKPVEWARPFVSQLSKFGPNVLMHDDYVDTFTQVLIRLRDRALLELPRHEEEVTEQVYERPVGNPYD
jgi:predicted phage terminase large subunit-like protein